MILANFYRFGVVADSVEISHGFFSFWCSLDFAVRVTGAQPVGRFRFLSLVEVLGVEQHQNRRVPISCHTPLNPSKTAPLKPEAPVNNADKGWLNGDFLGISFLTVYLVECR